MITRYENVAVSTLEGLLLKKTAVSTCDIISQAGSGYKHCVIPTDLSALTCDTKLKQNLAFFILIVGK